MRRLNKNEQDLCLRILNGDGNNNYLGNLIDHKLNGVRISLTRNPPNVDLLFTIQNAMPTDEEAEIVIDRVQEISVEILTVVNLINLLEKDGYIMLLQRTNQVDNNSIFGRGIGNMPAITSHFADRKISELLIDYTTKEIFVTEEFRQFCKHNFVARDEQRFRRQILITTTALVVATLALVVNTVFNLLPKFTGGTKIKQEQIESIRTDLTKINSTLDKINNQAVQTSDKLIEELKKRNEPKPINNKTKKNASH